MTTRGAGGPPKADLKINQTEALDLFSTWHSDSTGLVCSRNNRYIVKDK
jgi:hypothetical protein